MDLDGKRVLVTGASRGIGEGMARRFAAEGARVALVARSADVLEKLAADLGGDAYPADLAESEDRRSVWERIITDGPVDVLVNNAGVDEVNQFVGSDPTANDHLLSVNLHAPIHLTRLALPGMLAAGSGHIVNMSSMAAVVPLPGLSVYSASKAGLSQFTAGLRSELRGGPVGMTTVEIGVVTTAMAEHLHAYPPTERALRRLDRIQLSVEMPVDTVVDATVDAVISGRRHVRLPHRAAVFAMMVGFPRRFVELALTGVKV